MCLCVCQALLKMIKKIIKSKRYLWYLLRSNLLIIQSEVAQGGMMLDVITCVFAGSCHRNAFMYGVLITQ